MTSEDFKKRCDDFHEYLKSTKRKYMSFKQWLCDPQGRMS